MTTLYSSNDSSSGFDATTASAMPTGWAAISGTWAAAAAGAVNGHAQALACTSAQDGQVTLLTGVAAVADMDLVLSQKNFGTNPFMGAVVRADGAYNSAYLIVGYGSGSTTLAWLLFKRVGGSYSVLTTGSATLASATDPIRTRLRVIGSTI
jgi:hypothetical protein